MEISSDLSSLLSRLEQAAARLENAVGACKQTVNQHTVPLISGTGTSSAAGSLTSVASIESNDTSVNAALSQTLDKELNEFIAAANLLNNNDISEQAAAFRELTTATDSIIALASRARKPTENSGILLKIIEPLQTGCKKITDIREDNRKQSQWNNHMAMLSDGAPAFGWVTVDEKAAQYVSDMIQSAQFYANRIVNEFKEKDMIHVDFAQKFIAFLTALKTSVLKDYNKGLPWNDRGCDAESVLQELKYATEGKETSAKANAESARSHVVGSDTNADVSANASDIRDADKPKAGTNVFLGEINQGMNIMKGLKHVNRGAVQSSVQENTNSKQKPQVQETASLNAQSVNDRKSKAASIKLVGNKWIVENFVDKKDILVDNFEISQSVFITDCYDCVIQLKGKCNAVSMSK